MSTFELEQLDAEGWIALPGLFTSGEAAHLARRCVELIDTADTAAPRDKRTGGTHRAAALLDRLPELRTFPEQAGLAAAIAHLLGRPVPLTDLSMRCPQPGFGEQTLHADDMPITAAGECRGVTAIIALCDFTGENGATAVVPGSHRRPDLQRRVSRLDLSATEVVLTGAAGTAFLFSAHLLHRGTRNRSDQPRPALQAQWRLAPTLPFS